MSTSRRRYDASSYDENFCLRPSFLLWLAVLYLSRAITLPLLAGVGSLAGGSANTNDFMRGMFSIETLLPSLIAVSVLVALLRRTPAASDAVRWIWARGRVLLAISALLDGAFSLVRFGHHEPSVWALLTIAFDLYFLIFVLGSQRVRAVFEDFPAKPAAG